MTPPSGLSVVRLRHDGARNFIVKTVRPDKTDLAVNVIGRYSGARPLVGQEPLIFDIEADGAWEITIEPISQGGNPAVNGVGDSVSAVFAAPGNGPWEFSHQGSRNYIVRLHCANGSQLIQNRIGNFSGSSVVQFRGSPCFWEVQADGTWSHAPRP